MKGIICEQWGAPSRLRWGEIERPPLASGQVRIRVRASGVNFADTLMVAGKYQVKPAFPFSPGLEAAGEVIEVGAGVSHLEPGSRVLAVSRFGGSYAEELVVDAHIVVPLPDKVDFVTAAAFPVAYGTSHFALTHRGALRAGEWLVVTGAAGGVGLTAVEIGKQLGARVIAVAGGAEKCALAREYGADATIDHRQEKIGERIKELTGGTGADVVYDPVGGDVFDACMHAVNWEARLLIIGFAGGRIQAVPANHVLVKNVSVIGVVWGAQSVRDPDMIAAQLKMLLGWCAEGRLRPHISETFPLSEAPAAMEALLSRKFPGKLVLVS